MNPDPLRRDDVDIIKHIENLIARQQVIEQKIAAIERQVIELAALVILRQNEAR